MAFGHQLIQRIGHWSQTIVLLGPREAALRDFIKKLAGQVSLYNDKRLYEEFNLLNPSEKIIVLSDSGITQTLVEELLMREKDPTQFLTSEVIEKFDKNCDEECQQQKSEILLEIDIAIVKSDQYFEKEEETINSFINDSYKQLKIMTEISKTIGEFRTEYEPDYIKKKLNQQINLANNPCYPGKKSSCGEKGYLTQKQKQKMKKSVKKAKKLDEVEETSAEIKKSIDIKRKKYEKRNNIIKYQKVKVKSTWNKVKKGIKSMISPANLEKAATATSTILGAIGKTRDKYHLLRMS